VRTVSVPRHKNSQIWPKKCQVSEREVAQKGQRRLPSPHQHAYLNQVRLSNPRPTMWHACDRTAASACPLLSHPSQPSQAAAVRSSYLWHACDRTAAPACPLRVAEPLSPHGRGRVRPYDLAREVRGRVRPYDLCVVRLRPHCVASLLPLLLLIATQLIPRGLRPCAITNLVARP